jgi:ADP-ribose pyrophosphatase YjhB (NUDIX family)
VDVFIITKGNVDMMRNLKTDNKKVYSVPGGFNFKKGET